MSRYKNYLGYSKFDHRADQMDCDGIFINENENDDIPENDIDHQYLIIKIYEAIRDMVNEIGIPIFDDGFTHESVENYLEEADII